MVLLDLLTWDVGSNVILRKEKDSFTLGKHGHSQIGGRLTPRQPHNLFLCHTVRRACHEHFVLSCAAMEIWKLVLEVLRKHYRH
ncbi:hypothetical protein KIN20_013173 [Parelaphostrongylus tenuis]|uniref:Uncharacterized protein n=1 Tax=Parelaphostrongylus tenuis TaxID=148309 RepID=A0AAD5N1T0_PARTN|nr:hypothetical protein KIN20_013173 [Parelaphostrongylus tenuis]